MRTLIIKEIKEWSKSIIIALIIAFIFTTFAKPTLVMGISMQPSLQDKDLLILNRISYKFSSISRGDIISFKAPIKDENGKNKSFLKRVIGLEKDHIKIDQGKVLVNGKLLEEEYLNQDFTMGNVDTIVPKGHIFVLGDNREVSQDSRDPLVGFVKKTDVIGKVYFRVFPFKRIGNI